MGSEIDLEGFDILMGRREFMRGKFQEKAGGQEGVSSVKGGPLCFSRC